METSVVVRVVSEPLIYLERAYRVAEPQSHTSIVSAPRSVDKNDGDIAEGPDVRPHDRGKPRVLTIVHFDLRWLTRQTPIGDGLDAERIGVREHHTIWLRWRHTPIASTKPSTTPSMKQIPSRLSS